MQGKLVLVSITVNGRVNTKMVSGFSNGRGGWSVPWSAIVRMAEEIGYTPGQTIAFI